MAGIYIHIPFCKQLCYYCDFHFSISLKHKNELLDAVLKEIELRKEYLKNEEIETIYFGGGTPSVLSVNELSKLLNGVYSYFNVVTNPEITIEVNPDDLTKAYLTDIKKLGFNRLSIGIQSFDEVQLKLMNRRHNTKEAEKAVVEAQEAGFNNISIDLIYGLPNLLLPQWRKNIEKAINLNIQHISAYHLTIEPKTAFGKYLKSGKIKLITEEESIKQFEILVDETEKNGFLHYEISNFGKSHFLSQHNTNYWLQKKYIGFGPSAHSYNINSRQWNIANNKKYLELINANKPFFDEEILSITDKYNDYILTTLRTMWGTSLVEVETEFGKNFLKNCVDESQKYLDSGQLKLINNHLVLTLKGKFIADKIASDLFFINVCS